MKKIISFILIALMGISCTDNEMARTYGGKEKIKLKPGEVLLNITWKDTDMWVLTEDTATHTWHFRESSTFGIWEGEVIITRDSSKNK